MTFKEAKKILEKEGFYLIKFGGPSDIVNDPFSEYESPEIFEAGKVVNSAGYGVGMHGEVFNERKARLKKEYEENTKAPGPGEEQTKEKKGIIYPTTFPKADFYHKYFLNEGYSALKESAFQFNDALLDEQGKKIKRLGKEISKLNSIIHDKNAVLSDVAEELRLTKIREKNLAELGLKYVGENEELKKELANKVVDKIDAQALKSAESALAYKDKVIADLTKKLNVKHKKYVYYNGTIVAVQRLVNTLAGYAAKRYYKELCDQMVDIAEEGGDQSASIVVQCDNGITLSKEEAEIIERCTKNGTELHYSEKDGFTYTNVFGKEMPIRCLRGMFHVFTDEEIENMKK